MDRVTRQHLIAQYMRGPSVIAAAIKKIGRSNLDTRSAPDEWSPRQVVHHLADSEMAHAFRLRRLIAEPHPVIQAYNEAEFARQLHYDRPIETSLEAFRAARAASAELLGALTELQWSHVGFHTETGRYTVEDWLRIMAVHAEDHALQILSVAESAAPKAKARPPAVRSPSKAKRTKR